MRPTSVARIDSIACSRRGGYGGGGGKGENEGTVGLLLGLSEWGLSSARIRFDFGWGG